MKSLDVMVLEDSDDQVLILNAILKKVGATPVHCKNAESALQLLNSKRDFALILVDVGLPGMSGFDFAVRLKERRIQAPVIFITGSATGADVMQGILAGASDYIKKPYDPAVVEARLKAKLPFSPE